MFRYSGSKRRIIKHLPAPPEGTSTIVEPFAGSLAYSVHHRIPRIICAEKNALVRNLLIWLKDEATAERLSEINAMEFTAKVDIRTILGLSEPEQTLLRLQVASLMVGQLSSWTLYPQHSISLDGLIEELPYLKSALAFVGSDYRESRILEEMSKPDTLSFIDPPYINTNPNYKGKGVDFGVVSTEDIESVVNGSTGKSLVTYGDGAPELFSGFTWQEACKRKVPLMRTGGSKERIEWYSKVNW